MSIEYWNEQPATVAGMVLRDEPDSLARAEREDILSQLPPLESSVVLELGAGIGRYTAHFAETARKVTAVDFVGRFLDENRRLTAASGNVSYRCANVMNLEFATGSFDFVFMNWLLMYLDDNQIVRLRDSIHHWTRPGGIVFLRESCFVGASGLAPAHDYPARYRPDTDYMTLFEEGFTLLRRGNVKAYETRFNNPHQHYWLFQRGPA